MKLRTASSIWSTSCTRRATASATHSDVTIARATSSQGKTIIVQNVLEDWMSMSYDLSLERTAAVVHLQTILMISKMLHEWMTRLENFKSMSYLSGIIKTDLVRMKQAIDLPRRPMGVGGLQH